MKHRRDKKGNTAILKNGTFSIMKTIKKIHDI